MTHFYFSGIGEIKSYDLLKINGASHLLVDPHDLANVSTWQGPLALDSGAYRLFKEGMKKGAPLELTPAMTAELLRPLDPNRFTFITTCDVIGNPEKTYRNWRTLMRDYRLTTMPVWQWGAPIEHLREYLSESQLVGLGGTVPLLRNKQAKDFAAEITVRGIPVTREMLKQAVKSYEASRRAILEQLGEICARYPGRFHFFGLCWMQAINQLTPYLFSADSSLWLEGARKGLAVFVHAQTGKLAHAPKRAIPETRSLERDDLLGFNIREIEHFFSEERALHFA